MRTIKFRGKRTDKDEWIYGYLADGNCICDWDNKERRSFEVKAKTIGQYTGLVDKNGNEIYEGDILHVPGDDFNGEIKGVVMFEADSFVVKSIRSNWSALLAWCNRKDHETKHYVRPTKVIGNTYDNQELLKQ